MRPLCHFSKHVRLAFMPKSDATRLKIQDSVIDACDSGKLAYLRQHAEEMLVELGASTGAMSNKAALDHHQEQLSPLRTTLEVTF